ncbi:response regulator transcription factor [Hydrocarboniphaga sp.]|uniref:response regulator transcription factor n=1 Tax=Hydrocarboniphaga sp. TaxID=2033016 RepID=UPI003D147DC3
MFNYRASTADALTGRETEVLQLVVGGASNREIAGRTGVSENTIKFHLKNVFSKLDVSSRNGAVKVAMQRGLLQS